MALERFLTPVTDIVIESRTRIHLIYEVGLVLLQQEKLLLKFHQLIGATNEYYS